MTEAGISPPNGRRNDDTYDKTNLPEELIMSSYFSGRGDKSVSLAVIRNQPSPY